MSIDLSQKYKCLSCPIHTPQEAYLFFPSQEDQYEINPATKRPRRSIFEKISIEEYLPYENEKYNELMEYYEKKYSKDFSFPQNWPRTETMKCLQSAGFNLDKAIKKIKSQLDCPMPRLVYEQYEEILHSGFLYLHGLDVNYRPVLVASASKFIKLNKTHPLEHFICALEVFMCYLKEHFFISGQIENWVMIADINGVSMFKPPLDMIKLFQYIQVKYLCRLFVLYIFGMNSILNFCWKIVKKIVDEATTKKFVFINSDNADKPFTHIHPSQLEEKYGGTSPNVPDVLDFPFMLPSPQYSIDERNKEKIISETQYIELAMEHKLCAISPYLSNKISHIQSEMEKGNNVIIRHNDTAYFECDSQIEGNEYEMEKNIAKMDKLMKEEENEKSSDNGAATYMSDNKDGHCSERTTNVIPKVRGNANRNRMITIFETKEENGNCCAFKNSCIIF